MSRTIAALIMAAALLTAIADLRPPEYDEAYSIFLTAGHARPAWPATPFHPAQTRAFYSGSTSFRQIAENLRQGDVHPPLYFWTLNLWRHIFGPSWFTARLLSILYAVASLATLATLARQTKIPATPTILICLLTYGFAYTAIVARGFALAQLLLLLGVTLITRHCERSEAIQVPIHRPPQHPDLNLALAGLTLGAATFTNYLTLFTALTALTTLTLKSPRQSAIAWLTFALFLPADAWFFAIQHNTRAHQFAAFSFPHALALTAKDSAAAWFGGLPLYAGALALPVTIALILLASTTIFFIARNRTPQTLPLIALTLATPAGLLALGFIFHNTPIEIRYLAFSLPYLSLLIAASAPPPLRIALFTIQSLAIAGLALSPLTAQPQSAAAAQAAALAIPTTLVLLPFGNDGVGIPGPFIAASPDSLTIQLLHPNTKPDLTGQTTILLATITIDDDSRLAIAQTLIFLKTSPCWQQRTATPLIRQYRNTCAQHGQSIKLPNE
jgi:4-amino-4-deoxy-L-arabinose transferase-like glycosyltransferase